jgi:hypothetical protein
MTGSCTAQYLRGLGGRPTTETCGARGRLACPAWFPRVCFVGEWERWKPRARHLWRLRLSVCPRARARARVSLAVLEHV